MQIPRVATWKHVKYLSGIFRPIGIHANTTRSHVKTREIPLRNLQNYWKPCKYHENMWNTSQESSDLLEAIQIPRAATWKHVQCLSGIFRFIESRAKTTQSHMKIQKIPFRSRQAFWKPRFRNRQTYWKPCECHAKPCENIWNTDQESSDLLEIMQIPCRATWTYVTPRAWIVRLIRSHANTTQSHVKKHEMPLKNLQTYWKPCKHHAWPCEITWIPLRNLQTHWKPGENYAMPRDNKRNSAQESTHLLEAMRYHGEPRENIWDTAYKSLELLEAMQIPSRTTENNNILFRNCLNFWQPCRYRA